MSGKPITEPRQQSDPLPTALLNELQAPLVVAILALQGALALLLAARATAGPVAHGGGALAAVGGWIVWAVVAAALAALARWLWFAIEAPPNPLLDVTVRYLPLAAVSMTAASIPLAGAGLAVTAAAWLLLAVEELVVLAALPGGRLADRWLMFRAVWPAARERNSRGRNSRARGPIQRDAERQPVTEGSLHPETATRRQISPEVLSSDAACVQRLTRVQELNGSDRLEGSLATRFAAGQTTAQIHVAFCPSFARVPTLDYRQHAGPQARIKLGQLLPHGARFEVKLLEAASAPLQVTLEIVARHASEDRPTTSAAPGVSAERFPSSPL